MNIFSNLKHVFLLSVCPFLSSCGEPTTVMQTVAGVDFCVPRQLLVETDLWWVPRELPAGGFRIRLSFVPKENKQYSTTTTTRKMFNEINAIVGPLDSHVGLTRQTTDSIYVQAANLIDAKVKDSNRHNWSFVEKPFSKDEWVIWQPKLGPGDASKRVLPTSQIVALCAKKSRRPTRDDERPASEYIGCSRLLIAPTHTVYYRVDFDTTNLEDLRFDDLDELLRESVQSMTCRKE